MASPISTRALKPRVGEKDALVICMFQVPVTLKSVADRTAQRKGKRLAPTAWHGDQRGHMLYDSIYMK